jgi:ADP-ribose pyrophosphatase YjhB (NUDIX family)
VRSELGAVVPRVAVGAVVLDERDPDDPLVLLIKRAEPPNAGTWSLPGGKLELGESLASAVAREALEETGLDVQVGPLIDVFEIVTAAHHYVVLDYLCSAQSGAEPRAGGDAAECAWVRVAALREWGVTEAVIAMVTRGLAISRHTSA